MTSRLLCHVDLLSADTIAGWARYEPERERPVRLTARLGGECFTSFDCRDPRPDVVAAGLGVEACGFRLPIAGDGAGSRTLELCDDTGQRAELLVDGQALSVVTLP